MRKVRDRETGICRILPVPAGFRHCLLLCLFSEIEHPLTIDCRQQLSNIEQSDNLPVMVKYIAFLRSRGVDLNDLFDRITKF